MSTTNTDSDGDDSGDSANASVVSSRDSVTVSTTVSSGWLIKSWGTDSRMDADDVVVENTTTAGSMRSSWRCDSVLLNDAVTVTPTWLPTDTGCTSDSVTETDEPSLTTTDVSVDGSATTASYMHVYDDNDDDDDVLLVTAWKPLLHTQLPSTTAAFTSRQTHVFVPGIRT